MKKFITDYKKNVKEPTPLWICHLVHWSLTRITSDIHVKWKLNFLQQNYATAWILVHWFWRTNKIIQTCLDNHKSSPVDKSIWKFNVMFQRSYSMTATLPQLFYNTFHFIIFKKDLCVMSTAFSMEVIRSISCTLQHKISKSTIQVLKKQEKRKHLPCSQS